MSQDYLTGLTPAQKSAVEHLDGAAIVLAGPGSGKTRVITHRIAHLVEHHEISPTHVVAITFTNKAANEMRERVQGAVPKARAKKIVISTFHSLGARILRAEHERAQLSSGFTICDDDDTKSYLVQATAIVTEKDKKEIRGWKDWRNPDCSKRFISRLKSHLITPDEYFDQLMDQGGGDEKEFFYAKVYDKYNYFLRRNQSVDFDDLIMRTVRLLRDDEDVRTKYSTWTRHLLVDETQDTSVSQYEMVKYLASHWGNVFVVGDGDQSIYAFRLAQPKNLKLMERDYKDVSVYFLEENFRSTPPIAEVANSVIAHNPDRPDKSIKPVIKEGSPVRCVVYQDNRQEGAAVVDEITSAVRAGQAEFRDFALLYRAHFRSRIFEELLVTHNVPHKVVGGIGFYNRATVKDILAYLRLVVNGADESSFIRIYNKPPRRFGEVSYAKFYTAKEERNLTVMQAFKKRLHDEVLTGQARAGAEELRRIFKSLRTMPKDKVAPIIEQAAKLSGYATHLKKDSTEKGIDKLNHLQELIAAAHEFDATHGAGLLRFLEWAALMQSTDEETDGNHVHLMTCHAAKGLEFKQVYVVGATDGLMPIIKDTDDYGNPKSEGQLQEDLEEERRIFFVALTRAERELTVTWPRRELRFNQYMDCMPSPFIEEMGDTVAYADMSNTNAGSYLLRALDAKKRRGRGRRRGKRRQAGWR